LSEIDFKIIITPHIPLLLEVSTLFNIPFILGFLTVASLVTLLYCSYQSGVAATDRQEYLLAQAGGVAMVCLLVFFWATIGSLVWPWLSRVVTDLIG
jgi:hypothetical protein